MFTFSMRLSRKKVALCLVICLSIISAVYLFSGKKNTTEVSIDKISHDAKSNIQRVEFLTNFGWKIEENPLEVIEVTIPDKFDDVYYSYNEIQKQQGMDLIKISGKRVKRYTYQILNYPAVSGEVRANLLVYNDKIVGGDICSTNLDGFMHGFEMMETQTNTQIFYGG